MEEQKETLTRYGAKEQKLNWIVKNEQEYIDAITEAKGMLYTVCKNLGVSRTTVAYHVKTNPKIREALIQAREETKDIAESRLFTKIDEGNLDAIKYYLSHQARDRGYSDVLVTENTNMNANINVDLSKLTLEELEVMNGILSRLSNTSSNNESNIIDTEFTSNPEGTE